MNYNIPIKFFANICICVHNSCQGECCWNSAENISLRKKLNYFLLPKKFQLLTTPLN